MVYGSKGTKGVFENLFSNFFILSFCYEYDLIIANLKIKVKV